MLLTKGQQDKIIAAIKQAERQTSGEVKVHIEELCPETDVMERAKQVFLYLALEKTAAKNGVLFYLAHQDKKFAVLGDSGIDAVVPAGFWESTKETLRIHFAEGKFAEGLVSGVQATGEQLKKYFPYHKSDVNEISDEISFG
jgi:uncharacterized membrane protein